MQEQDGTLREIDQLRFKEEIKKLGTMAPVIQVGEIFYVRGCKFQASEITLDGIFATGIARE